MPAVRTRTITMEFTTGDTRTRVLHGVDMAIQAGQLTMLVGPSGCGKTTLLSIIAGILTPTVGTVEVFGTVLQTLKKRELVRFRRENIGFIFQQYNLLPSLTAAENVAVPLVAAGMQLSRATRQGVDQLARLGLADHAHKLPAHLSGGQQQRVAIGRALVHQPRLIVCDEPTAALDATTGLSVLDTLRAHGRAADRAVLVVTHDPRIYRFADRILSMEDGQLVGSTDDYRTLYTDTSPHA
jgi:putative ABC transport system ATP-binding protein